MNRLLDDLNPAQREAVTTTEGPLLVIAGAGSGKTRVLTRRLAYLLYQGLAQPHQILAVTFTNKAAGEMKERVAALMGGEVPNLQVSTFHSFCAKLLRIEGEHLGYPSDFTIFDQNDSLTLTKNVIVELSINTNQFVPKAQQRKISDAKNRLVSAEEFARQASGYFQTTTAQIYTAYQQRLRQCRSMDFDDLLFNAVTVLTNFPEVGHRYRTRFRYLLVDEYQDTNRVQYLLLRALLGDLKNICVVGDEDQSIYGWRGADISNILEFERDFPGARVIKLEQNYRSTKTILNAASSVIKNNQTRKDKTLWSDGEQGGRLQLLLVDDADAEAVRLTDLIEGKKGRVPLREMAVLYRTNAQSRPFEEQLRRRNLPYQIVGGISFYQRKEIKDLLAYLKLIVNPKDDISFQRIINYPKRGLGDKTLQAITAKARQLRLSEYETVLSHRADLEVSRSATRLESFVALIEKYRSRASEMPVDLLTQELVEELGLINELRQEDEVIAQTRVENVEALIEGMAQYARGDGEATLMNYLTEISLFTDLDAYSDAEDKVTLMTLHAAKGLEFDTVFIAGLEEGLFPLQRTITEPLELEEERRLFYVGATRARRELCLSSAATRYRFAEVASVISRFVGEIPRELVEESDFRSRPTWQGYARPAPQPAPATPEGVHYEYEGLEGLTTGRVVQHPTFGRGTVVAVDGYGESLRLDIMFAGLGLKKIMAKYARLKLIG